METGRVRTFHFWEKTSRRAQSLLNCDQTPAFSSDSMLRSLEREKAFQNEQDARDECGPVSTENPLDQAWSLPSGLPAPCGSQAFNGFITQPYKNVEANTFSKRHNPASSKKNHPILSSDPARVSPLTEMDCPGSSLIPYA
jgi:hypothetical protein